MVSEMFNNLINRSMVNETINATYCRDELMCLAHAEVVMIFWAVISLVGVVGAIAYASGIPSMKASGIQLMQSSIIAAVMFYVLPGIIHDVSVMAGW